MLTALKRFAWINALLLVAIALGMAVTAASPASAATTEERAEESPTSPDDEKIELLPIDDPSEVPPAPPTDDAGIEEAKGIVEALGGCDLLAKGIVHYMRVMDKAYHANDPEGYVEAFDMIGLLRWAGQVFCGFK
jgi:hypothetical protein